MCTIKYRRVGCLRQLRLNLKTNGRFGRVKTVFRSRQIRRIRFWLGVVIAALLVSGVTAFPLETELGWIVRNISWVQLPGLVAWLNHVHDGLAATNHTYPFLAYGTDWLAFAHIVLAILFIGPWRDPVRNKWVVQFGLIACVGVLILALIAGPIRGIPFYWRMIDCSFGVIGAIPLLLCLKSIAELEQQ